jgi:phosphoribosylamine--glycine ligase
LDGEENSVFAGCDGSDFVILPPAQDHKRLLEGDRGPNTGGMGAYTPVSIATRAVLQDVADRVVGPTLTAMRLRGAPFRGLLYCGMMLTADGAKVVEYNCRFGDPETQVVLPVLKAGLLDLRMRSSTSGLGASGDASASEGAAVTTVVAAPGYPDTPRTGGEIQIPDAPAGVLTFHAGTARDITGRLVSSGGRVLAVTGVAPDFAEAAALSREHASKIRLADAQLRRDIGWREMERRARAAGN